MIRILAVLAQQQQPPTGFWAELVRDTLLGAAIGVVPLALIMATHHFLSWRRGVPDAAVYLVVRLGTMFLVVPIIFLVWPLDVLDPTDWHTLMFTAGLLMVGGGYFTFARRWGKPGKGWSERNGDGISPGEGRR